MRKLHWSLLKRLYRLRGRFAVHGRLQRLWLLDNRNWIDQQLLIRRPYEVEQIARCRQLIRKQGLTHFFDIGANFGLYTILLSDEPSLIELHAFEPLPRNAHQFAANLYLNGLDDRVSLHTLALSDHAGQAELHVDPKSTGVSTIDSEQSCSRTGAYRSCILVQTHTFDELFDLRGVRALVKIDVEGAELQVLTGMKTFLSANAVTLQVETMPRTQAQVDGFMAAASYSNIGRIGADVYYAKP